MKLKSQIVGLPVITIAEVAELGYVEDLIINPGSGSVDYLIVQPENWYLERRLISAQDVAGIGEDALITETKSNVVNITSVEAALELLEKGVEVVGSQVMTKKGRKNGIIDEIVIDEQTGKITACRWVAGDGKTTGLIPANLVITLGKGMLVVEDHFQSALLDNASQMDNTTNVENTTITPIQKQPPVVTEDPLQHFEDKQKQYLIGRTVTTDILTDDGQIIAEQGQKITRDMVDRAAAADKFVELTLNTRE
ncbi:PRC-barrel domain-containing protein [Desulforamulus aeronauticus]|uniref:Uncharacterized protein YrrD, contains PRC-barrel domain n=1 Tax=Desulforamulus aeronauticus DSM 10349 TaxID=1121421 RepID=A0A1M6TM67_9FIRM|nr:PRC-barrel domain-containing protein [Desulforamulus aeronauticus]SHK58085.1 Uncharacterized protein YrrD, contains PRC-barrel domain [Desulforamulus aeronauticus DSM 10349]